MSNIRVNTINDASGGSSAILYGVASPPNSMGFRNRILNGAMVIDQRNAGAEVNPAVSGSYYLDRWIVQSSQTSKFKIGRNAGAVTPPTGFTNYLGCTSLSAYSVVAADAFNVGQRLEGLNVSDLAWGTASASTVTLSFWVYSSLTGTFGGSVQNSASDRSYPFSYTVSAANTWELETVTIPGDTTGTWLTDNGIGIRLFFSLGTGSTQSGTAGAWAAGNFRSTTGATSVVGTNGATFYITGVQLEAGTVASPFERRPYGTELQLCKRYLPAFSSLSVVGQATGTTTARFVLPLGVQTRANISGLTNTVTLTNCYVYTGGFGGAQQLTGISIAPSYLTWDNSVCFDATVASGLTTGAMVVLNFNATAGQAIYFNGAEL